MYLTPVVWFQYFLQFIEIIVLESLVSKPKFCPVITYKVAYFLQRLSCRWDQNELSKRTKINKYSSLLAPFPGQEE